MSAASQQKKPAGQERSSGSHTENMELMHEIGARSYNPMPPSQHSWQMAKDQPPLLRMWSWMTYHCLHHGHRSPFAVLKGMNGEWIEAHMEHVMADLEMDEGNCYRTWLQGVERGLWANTPLDSTKRDRRLYYRGNVPTPKERAVEKGEEEANTNCLHRQLQKQRPYIRKSLEALAPEEREAALVELEVADRLYGRILADVTMAVRNNIIGPMQNSIFERHSVKKIRELHIRKAETPDDRFSREGRLAQFTPPLELYVQTVFPSVQAEVKSLLEAEKQSVGTAATLLPQKPEKRPDPERAILSSGPHSHGEGQQPRDEQEPKQLPALQTVKLSDSEKEALNLLFSEFKRMQKAYPRSDFGQQPISAQSKADQLIVFRILHAVGAANVIDFLGTCVSKFKGLDRNALGKMTPRSPRVIGGPRSFGLILTWAQDYGRRLDESARAPAEEQKQMRAAEIAACVALLGDPHEPEANKQHYRKLLASYGVPLTAAALPRNLRGAANVSTPQSVNTESRYSLPAKSATPKKE